MSSFKLVGVSLVTAAALGLGACNASDTVAQDTARLQESMGEAEVVLVAMHADWCGACERMGPEVMEAMQTMGDSRIKLVKADLTDKKTPAGKAELEGMGLGELYAKNKGKTGILYIVDAQTGEILGKVQGKRAKSETIVADVNAALAKAVG